MDVLPLEDSCGLNGVNAYIVSSHLNVLSGMFVPSPDADNNKLIWHSSLFASPLVFGHIPFVVLNTLLDADSNEQDY